MPKPKPQPTNHPDEQEHHEKNQDNLQVPLSGSKKVKNRNHSRQNHGEGI